MYIISDDVNNRYRQYINYTILNKGIDPRDGLKTSQRMILYAAYKVAKSRIKSARLVGEVLANYWPHGDQSIYGTIGTLVDAGLMTGYGEWGDFNYGTEPAAMRYTELQISDLALDLLFDSDELECVEYTENFDNRLKIPVYLPSKLPISLIAGVDTIGIEEFSNINIHKYTIDSVKETVDSFLKGENKIKLVVKTDEDCIVQGDTVYPSIKETKDEVILTANTRKYNYQTIMNMLKNAGLEATNLSTDKTHIEIRKKKGFDIPKFLNNKLSYKIKFDLGGYGFNKNFDMGIFHSNVDLKSYLELFVLFRKDLNIRVTENKINKLKKEIDFFKILDIYKSADIKTISKQVPDVNNMNIGHLVKLLDSDLEKKIKELETKKKDYSSNLKKLKK